MPAPQISPLPTPPSRSQSPDTFSTDADAFLGALPDFQAEANDQADYLDALAIQVDADATTASNAAAAAAGAANYQGDYNAGTTYQIGESVSYNGRRYVAKTINTGVTPADGANWFLINDGDVLGPASATNNALAIFDGTTGKFIKSPLGNGTNGEILTSGGAGNPPTFLAQGANGALLTSGGSGNAPTFLAQGTSGQVLVSNGAGNAPSFTTLNTGVQFPQSIKTADYTLVLTDAGKQIFHPNSDGVIRTFTIPANSSVAFPIGTVMLFTADVGSPPIKVAINTDNLVTGEGLTGTVTVPPNNSLMAIKVSATKWMANFLFQNSQGGQVIFYGIGATPYLTAMKINSQGGVQGFSLPTTIASLGSEPFDLDFHPSGNAIAIARFNGTPNNWVLRWSVNGFGNPYAAIPTSFTGYGWACKFSPSGDALVWGNSDAPYIHAYRWQSGVGYGAKYADPATALTGEVRKLSFHPSGNAIAICGGGSPTFHAYAWSSANGFGTKYANASTLPSGLGESIVFNSAGDAVAMTSTITPYIHVFAWNSSTGFGTKFADPSTLPLGSAYSVAFSPNSDAIAVAHAVSPFVSVYAWSSSGFGSKYANPSSAPIDYGREIGFTPLGDYILLMDRNTNSPPIHIYPWNSATGFGTRLNLGLSNNQNYDSLAVGIDR